MKQLISIFAMLLISMAVVADEKNAPQTDSGAKVQIGSKAPDFTVTGIDGKTFKLSEKIQSGRKNIVLLFSRAHW